MLDLLDDELVSTATMEISSEGKTRPQVQKEIKQKERARDYLAHTYQKQGCSKDDILHCLYSVGDNNSYLGDALSL